MSPPFKVFLLTLLAAFCHGQVPSPSESAWPTQSFKTAPSARAPVLDITKSGAPLAPGYLMMTEIPVTDEVANSSFIMTDTGDLVWYSNPGTYSNLVVQSLDSQPVLSCWNGTSINEQGYGFISILDTTYTEIYRVCPDIVALTPGNTTFPCYADIHESYITDRGSILVTVYNIAPADLTFVNGSKNGWVYDNLFYEVDIKTNRTLFRWSALESIPLTSTEAVLGNFGFGNGSLTSPFDWFHINSVQSVGSSYLINARHTWSSYFLSSNGSIHWQIQGETGGDFSLPNDGQFTWQHHARLQNVTQNSGILQYFNNYNGDAPLFNGSHEAEGLEFSLDFQNRTASLLKNLVDPNEPIFPIAAGSFSPLPNGNTILGYGTYPSIKEFGPDGDVRMSIQFGLTGTSNPAGFTSLSYRTFRQPWVGTPATPPIAVADQNDGFLYLSWNGATGITAWEVFCANSTQQDVHSLGVVQNTGFETRFNLANSTCRSSVQAAASRDGNWLRYTDFVSVASG